MKDAIEIQGNGAWGHGIMINNNNNSLSVIILLHFLHVERTRNVFFGGKVIRGHTIAFFRYLKGCHEEEGEQPFPLATE